MTKTTTMRGLDAFVGVFYPARHKVIPFGFQTNPFEGLQAIEAMADPAFWDECLGKGTLRAPDLLNRCMGAVVNHVCTRLDGPLLNLLLHAIVEISDDRYQWLDVTQLAPSEPGEHVFDVQRYSLRARSTKHAYQLFSQEPRVSLAMSINRTWVMHPDEHLVRDQQAVEAAVA